MRDSTALAEELVRRSGLDEVRELLNVRFTERSGLLKARSALLGLDRALREHLRTARSHSAPRWNGSWRGARVSRSWPCSARRAHRASFEESFGDEEDVVAERLLGATGTSSVQRLGLDRTQRSRRSDPPPSMRCMNGVHARRAL